MNIPSVAVVTAIGALAAAVALLFRCYQRAIGDLNACQEARISQLVDAEQDLRKIRDVLLKKRNSGGENP